MHESTTPPARRSARWGLFSAAVLLAATTLAMMIRSGDRTDLLLIRSPVQRYGGLTVWCVASSLGYVAVDFEEVVPGFTGSSMLPFVEVQSLDGGSIRVTEEPLRFPYAWLLGAEALALFFLVPSVLATGRRRD